MASTLEPIPGARVQTSPPLPPPPPSPAALAPGGGERPPLGPVRRTVREIGYTLITAGLVVLLFVAYQLWGTAIAEANSQHDLKKQFNQLLAEPPPTVAAPSGAAPTPTTPTTPTPAPPTGDAVGHLVIPKIGIDKFIVEGVTLTQLRKGPGHYPQTPMPGQKGNAAIAGHRTTYGAPFYRLNELQPGDDIYVTTTAGRFHYSVVESKVVKPSEVSVLDPTPDNRLTLTTCTPRYSASRRLVVVSRLMDTPAPTPPPPRPVAAGPSVTTIPSQLNLGAGDSQAWPPTILFGLVAVGLWVGVRIWAAKSRPGALRWLPFLVGIPVCLVPLWFLFENVIRLLPANI
ncbi:MAG TPA: class E sortase [Acidimicrobiales bacterium]|nr:class E sortase [Acidimicrobiales bacterium]